MNYEDWIKINTVKPLPINQDTIRQLRAEGNGTTARLLLKAYYKELKQIKQQTKHEFNSLQYKKKLVRGLCGTKGCKRPLFKGGQCKKCYDGKRKSHRALMIRRGIKPRPPANDTRRKEK